MSAFEISINVGDYGYAVPSEEDIKRGAPPRMDVVLNVVQVLGMGPGGQMAAVPLGAVKFGMGKEDAERFFKTGLEQAEILPAESKITVASDLSQAEQMGRDLDQFRNGNSS